MGSSVGTQNIEASCMSTAKFDMLHHLLTDLQICSKISHGGQHETSGSVSDDEKPSLLCTLIHADKICNNNYLFELLYQIKTIVTAT